MKRLGIRGPQREGCGPQGRYPKREVAYGTSTVFRISVMISSEVMFSASAS